MRRHVRTAVLIGLAALAGTAASPSFAAPDARAEREILHLIEFVSASGCTFLRNGDAHDAQSAGDHLAMKYGKARKRLPTPEAFIEHVATRSYFSGREYRVRCPGKPEQASALWLDNELKAMRSGVTAALSTPVRAARVPD